MRKIEGQWRDDACSMRDSGMTRRAIANTLTERYPEAFSGLTLEQAEDRVRKAEGSRRRDMAAGTAQEAPAARMNAQEMLMDSLTRGTTIKGLADRIGVTERVAAVMIDEKKLAGYNVQEQEAGTYRIAKTMPPTENRYSKEWNGEKIIRFGLTGDSHISSKYVQLTHLHALYDIYAREGIQTVYHTGDIDDGEHMHVGHEYELYRHGADDHVEEISNVYPKRDGVNTEFITGNHDLSYAKGSGLDIGYRIANLRPDMKYLGMGSAVIQLSDNCALELRHPIDGTAYALSYKTQKMIDAMSGGEKPNILGVGHYHKAEYLFYRNVHCIQTGTLCGQTPWMKGKQIAAHVGGWLVEVHVHDDGAVSRIKQEFIPFYRSVKDDWKNWR